MGFAFNQAELDLKDKNIKSIMENLAKIMKNNSSIKLEIRGHTDNIGDNDFNLRLSFRRAESVKGYLVNLGVRTDRVITKGFGEDIPVSSNLTGDGRALNRRVEFFIIK